MSDVSDDELLALCDAVIEGPWGFEKETRTGPNSIFQFVYAGMPPDGGGGIGTTIAQWVLPREAAFIAAARTALPEKLAELATLRAALAEALDMIRREVMGDGFEPDLHEKIEEMQKLVTP